MTSKCPFRVGDIVYFRSHHLGKYVNEVGSYPRIGEAVKITKIQNGLFVVWEGQTGPGGGIFWTEFAPN